ncbi:MAG TPA: hypothetical protein VIW73_08660 [Candidatus Cybelea sp.]
MNRRRVRGYESGTVIPTVATAYRLAEIYGVSALRLLHKAGHDIELLRPIVWLLGAREIFARASQAAVSPAFFPDLLCQVGVLFALYAFPRRGEVLSLAGAVEEADLEKAFSTATSFDQPRGKLPHAIGLAKLALRDSSLAPEARRSIAAEYVHAYVHSMEPERYAKALKRIYQQEKPE